MREAGVRGGACRTATSPPCSSHRQVGSSPSWHRFTPVEGQKKREKTPGRAGKAWQFELKMATLPPDNSHRQVSSLPAWHTSTPEGRVRIAKETAATADDRQLTALQAATGKRALRLLGTNLLIPSVTLPHHPALRSSPSLTSVATIFDPSRRRASSVIVGSQVRRADCIRGSSVPSTASTRRRVGSSRMEYTFSVSVLRHQTSR